jgi:hypothetical protein
VARVFISGAAARRMIELGNRVQNTRMTSPTAPPVTEPEHRGEADVKRGVPLKGLSHGERRSAAWGRAGGGFGMGCQRATFPSWGVYSVGAREPLGGRVCAKTACGCCHPRGRFDCR